MKLYITKYALTKGIFEVEAQLCSSEMIKVPGRYSVYYHGEGLQWHRTFESAQTRAEAMRAAKQESLRKSMANLQKLDFSKPRKP